MHLLPDARRADEPSRGGGARAGLVGGELALRGEREGQQQLEDLQQLRVAAQQRLPARARAAAPCRIEHAVEEYRVEPLPRAEQAQRLAARAVEPMSKPRRLSLRPAGSPEPPLSAGACLRLPKLRPASVNQPAGPHQCWPTIQALFPT